MKYRFSLPFIKIDRDDNDDETKKWKFYYHKHVFKKKKGCRYLKILLTRFLLVRKKIKYFIGYINGDYKIKPVCIMLS